MEKFKVKTLKSVNKWNKNLVPFTAKDIKAIKEMAKDAEKILSQGEELAPDEILTIMDHYIKVLSKGKYKVDISEYEDFLFVLSCYVAIFIAELYDGYLVFDKESGINILISDNECGYYIFKAEAAVYKSYFDKNFSIDKFWEIVAQKVDSTNY